MTPSKIATYLAALADWRANSRWSKPAPTLPGGANLDGANLDGANLDGANLDGANLVRASLVGASLVGADLVQANLVRANLDGANLVQANLVRANLDGASLVGASLVGASLVGATMPAGYKWEAYLAQVVPALLTGGGKALGDILDTLRASGGWAHCHAWSNCPLHVAYDTEGFDKIPLHLLWEAKQFVQFFDAKLIPEPMLTAMDPAT